MIGSSNVQNRGSRQIERWGWKLRGSWKARRYFGRIVIEIWSEHEWKLSLI